MSDTHQEKMDAAAGYWRVRIHRCGPGKYSQLAYFTTNPQRGGFGTNLSHTSVRRAILQAIRNIPVGATYRLLVHDEDKGLHIKREA